MLEWVFSVPLFGLAFVIVAAFALLAFFGLSITRRIIGPWLGTSSHDNEFAGAILNGILVMYGLAVALIAVAGWENYAKVSEIVSNEATAIAMLYRDSSAYPEPTRGQLQHDLRIYTEYVIQEAWPQQRNGQVPAGGVELMDRVQDDLFAFMPTSEAQSILHAEALHAYNRLVETRRLRLDAVNTGLPTTMWGIVLFGAVISLSAAFFFHVESVRLHNIMVALLAALMALVIYLIVIYDHPFRGTHGIGPEAYQLIYDHLMKP
jgi:hypothetical protein